MASRITASTSNYRGVSKTTGRGATRTATRESMAWNAANLQVAREGSKADIASRLADMRARGDITRLPEETDLDEEDQKNAEAIDAEIDLADEDQSRLEDIDGTPDEFSGMPRRPGQTLLIDEDPLERFVDFEMRGSEGKCSFLRPEWMRAEPLTDAGEEFLDEIGTRFGVLDAIGLWLENKRVEFLHKPEPMALGIRALEEMKQGLPSVSPSSFVKLSEIESRIEHLAGRGPKKRQDVNSLFSRFTAHCDLVWANGSLPLDVLFSIEARKAWVASAVLQLCEQSGTPLTTERLAKYRNLTVPKGSDEKKHLNAMNISSLSFPDFIRRANSMAETKWSDVVTSYLRDYL